MEETKTPTSPESIPANGRRIFSWKKFGYMLAIGVGLGVGAWLLGYGYIGSGILWGLPLGLFNYYLACRAVGFLGTEGGARRFGATVALRWTLAVIALVLAFRVDVWFLLGVAVGVEVQMLAQLGEAIAVLSGLKRVA